MFKKVNFKIIIAITIILISIIIVCLAGQKPVGLTKGTIKAPEVQEQVQAALDTDVDAGMASVFINTNILMDRNTFPAPLFIQNSEKNNYAQQIEILKKNTEEVIYSSPIVDPGYKIENDYLNIALESGIYECIARISFLSLDDYSVINTSDVLINIKIK